MRSTVLDRIVLDRAADGEVVTLGRLHDAVGHHQYSALPCRANDPELWFAEAPDDVEVAKGLCRSCPVQRGCFDSALSRSEPWGVWGGELFCMGVVIPRKRPRGRPRKATR
jgi:WhiB family transcriptional regulator, redox-sensing transcriptional regulator